MQKWDRFATNNGRFKSGHPEYRRAYLINITLVAMAIVFILFLIFDVTIFNLPLVAANNLIGALLSIAVLCFFHKNDRIQTAANLTIFIELFVLAGLLLYMEHRQYALFWIAVIPLSSYFLLGRKLGLRVSVAVFLCLVAFFVVRFNSWQEAGFGLEALFNVVLALCSLTLMVSYYEQSRYEAIVALEQKNIELERLSVTDKLTGIFNRMRLDEVLSYELLNAARYGRTFSVIMGDIDHFKSVNDRFGHVAGDAVLVDIAKLIKTACRCIDTVGRWGGEEFLIICPETKIDGAYGLAERLRKSIASNVFPIADRVTISFGMSEYAKGDDIPSLLKRADEALYAAKEKGRNCVEC